MHNEKKYVRNGFSATVIDEGTEVVIGEINSLLTYLPMEDVAHLHTIFLDHLYREHPLFNQLLPYK